MKAAGIDDQVETDVWVVRKNVGLDQFKCDARILSPTSGMH